MNPTRRKKLYRMKLARERSEELNRSVIEEVIVAEPIVVPEPVVEVASIEEPKPVSKRTKKVVEPVIEVPVEPVIETPVEPVAEPVVETPVTE